MAKSGGCESEEAGEPEEPATAAAATAATATAPATAPLATPPAVNPFYEPAFAAVSLPPLEGGVVRWIQALATANPFWFDIAVLLLLGGFLGCVGFSFLKAFSSFTTLWLSADGNAAFPAAPTLRFGAGRAWWVALCGGFGLAAGLCKATLRVDKTPGFVAELRTMEVNTVLGLKTGVLALLGLMGGMPLGPEAGLGAVAGGLGTLLGRRLHGSEHEGKAASASAAARGRLYTVSGMASVFACLFPNPLSAVLLTLEIGRTPCLLPSMSVMQLIIALSAASTAAFVTYCSIAGYLFPYMQGGSSSSSTATPGSHNDNNLYLAEGILFGLMGSAMGAAYELIGLLVKAAVAPARAALEARLGRWPRVVVLSTCGGLAVGLLGWGMPLVLTDGSLQLDAILTQRTAIGSPVLAASCFAKMLAYHVCVECGIVGGLFIPMLSMGAMMGAVMTNELGVDPGVSQPCSLIALAAALTTGPFFLAVLAVRVLTIAPEVLVAIFACITTAYLFCRGIGVPAALATAAAWRPRPRLRAQSPTRV